MKPKVLPLCTGKSARSQMAEALLRHQAGDRFDVHGAGLEPKGVNPNKLAAPREAMDLIEARVTERLAQIRAIADT